MISRLLKADLMQTMNEVYESLGLYGDAEGLIGKGRDIRSECLSESLRCCTDFGHQISLYSMSPIAEEYGERPFSEH